MKKYSLVFMISLIYLIVCFPKAVFAAEVGPTEPGAGEWDLYVEETFIRDRDSGQANIKSYSVMLVGNGSNSNLGGLGIAGDNDTSIVKFTLSGGEVLSNVKMYFDNDPKTQIADQYSIRWGKSKEEGLLFIRWGNKPIYIIKLNYEISDKDNRDVAAIARRFI